jgi:hypothetical protein
MLSEILHRIPPPPYHSPLELKLFKRLLEWHTEVLEDIAGITHKQEH